MSSTLNYAPLLPFQLKSDLESLTKTYSGDCLPVLNKAFYGLFTAVPSPTPDIISVRNLVLGACLDAVPAIHDISTYSSAFSSVVVALGNDKDAIVTALRPVVAGWKSINFHALTDSQERIYLLIDAFPRTDDIIAALNEFVDELNLPQTSDIHPPYYDHSIFDIVTPTLAPIATFDDTDHGKALFADRLRLSVAEVTQPLRVVFNPPADGTTRKLTPSMVAASITQAIIAPIQSYVATLNDIIRDFGSLVNLLGAVSASMIAVSRGIELFAQGTIGASTSTAKIVIAQEAVDAWTAVGPLADAFISALSSGRVTSGSSTLSARVVSNPIRLPSTTQTRVFSANQLLKLQLPMAAASDRSPDVSITKKEVTGSFGAPPAYSAQTLPDMSATSGKIAADFTKIMTLPFIDQLKVTGADGQETSLGAVMLSCKTQYETLQKRTIPIVRDLSAYSTLQQTILPTVGKTLPLTEFLQANLWLVMKYGASAKQIAKDTRALLDDFQKFHDTLLRNLDEINKSIVANEAALAAAQAQYNALIAKSIIEGLIALIATVGAIAALVTGEGPLAATLGVVAAGNFGLMVADAVAANKLPAVISSLRSIISSSKTTADELKKVIPVLQDIIELMSQISDIWDSIDGSLTSVQQEYALWNNPSYFTPAMVTDAVASWLNVGNQCLAYIKIASDDPTPPITLNLLAVTFGPAKKTNVNSPLFFASAADSPPPYDALTDPVAQRWFSPATDADRKWKFKSFVSAQQDDALLAAFEAPQFALACNRAQLTGAASQYDQAASSITSGNIGSVTSDLQNLSLVLSDSLIPALSATVAFYVKFAAGQSDPFAQPMTKERLAVITSDRMRQLTAGSDLAKAAEAVFIKFQGSSQLVLDNLIAQIKAQEKELEIKNQSLQDHQSELSKYDWVKYWPIPPGLGAIIDAIINSVRRDQAAINDLNREIGALNVAHTQVTAALSLSTPCHDLTTALSQGWSTLTTQTQQLQTFEQILEDNPTRDAKLRPIVQGSWDTLSTNLSHW